MTKKAKLFLALGDSYTIGEGVDQHERWPNLLVEELNKRGHTYQKPVIIATTGWRTDNLLNAMQIARLQPHYDLVSILIGVNDEYQKKDFIQSTKNFDKLIKQAIQLAKSKADKVFVLSIPDYGYTPFGQSRQQEITKNINQYNQVQKKIALDAGVCYISITDISRQTSHDNTLLVNDQLHPSGSMYRAWVQRIIYHFF